ncbi:hypothetical protein [Spiroplasma endosymbiont of Aspidapion aeneum]|uniref:hypothetical protein n=1 Tax=Spiroplasma endosymbiont of Aspidapion aeneum TaxID=3066276 RepID=UPI00313D33C7
MKKIAVFGATGSVGLQALSLLRENRDYELVCVSAYTNKMAIKKIIKKFDSIKAISLRDFIGVKNIHEHNNILDLFAYDFDYIINAVSGFAGLKITLKAIEENKIIFLANKESYVTAGKLINDLLKKYTQAKIFPLDSEHAGLFQLLKNEKSEDIKELIITASGGPFLNKSLDETKYVSYDEVFKHPTWTMGKKITIDSATMFNKALEIIEASNMFQTKNINVLVQPQSLVHAMLKFNDDSYKMSFSLPDMQQVISYFLNDCRFHSFFNQKNIDFSKMINFSLQAIDRERFIPIKLAFDAINSFNSKAISLNAANEVCVSAFIAKKIKFYQITEVVAEVYKNSVNKELKNYTEISKFHEAICQKTLLSIENI